MQIVERRIGREGADDLGLEAAKRVGQRQELRRRLADAEHPQRPGLGLRQLQAATAFGEGLQPQLELLLRDRRAHEALQPHHRLRRMQRRGQGQVETVRDQLRIGIGDRHHRQAARRTGGLQPAGEGQGLVAGADQIDDGGFDLQIAQRGDGGERPTRGDRAPAKAVEAVGKRPRPLVLTSDN